MNYQGSNFLEDNLENLKIISRCPVCNAKYNTTEIRVLDEKENSYLVYIQCRRCQSSVLAVILANQLGISSVGLVTDLIGEDVIKFKDQVGVTCDDAIYIHEQLKIRNIIKEIEYL